MEENKTLKEKIGSEVESLLRNWTFDNFEVDADRYKATFDIFGEQNTLTIDIKKDVGDDCYCVVVEAVEYEENEFLSISQECDIDGLTRTVQSVIKECVDDYFYYTFN